MQATTRGGSSIQVVAVLRTVRKAKGSFSNGYCSFEAELGVSSGKLLATGERNESNHL